MKWLLREVRLLPLVMVAITSLLALKTVGLVTSGSYVLGNKPLQAEEAMQPRGASRFSAHDAFVNSDITGAVPAAKPAEKEAAKPEGAKAGGKPEEQKTDKPQAAAPPKPAPEGRSIPVDGKPLSPAERAILERLQERRQELDARAKELEMRESLIGTAEKHLESRILELKDMEARVNAAMNKREEAEAAKFKSVVTMYENMKAKEAARIFDRLDLKVLLDVASQINPRRMSDILAQMSPEAAERLTIELAGRAKTPEKGLMPGDLPKIEGRPSGT